MIDFRRFSVASCLGRRCIHRHTTTMMLVICTSFFMLWVVTMVMMFSKLSYESLQKRKCEAKFSVPECEYILVPKAAECRSESCS